MHICCNLKVCVEEWHTYFKTYIHESIWKRIKETNRFPAITVHSSWTHALIWLLWYNLHILYMHISPRMENCCCLLLRWWLLDAPIYKKVLLRAIVLLFFPPRHPSVRPLSSPSLICCFFLFVMEKKPFPFKKWENNKHKDHEEDKVKTDKKRAASILVENIS